MIVPHGYDQHGAHSYADTMAGCGDAPCKRCGAYCTDRDECDLALDGVSPALWRNPERNAS
jgi:hypothetical protein